MATCASYGLKKLLCPLWWRVRRFLVPPEMPRNPDGQVRLHLGCGLIDASGYINVDLRPSPNVHLVNDIYPLPMFADDSVDLIYASHVLEHLPKADVRPAIMEWYRILKHDGVLRLAVPDFSVIVQMYVEHRKLDLVSGPLMGAQSYAENYHKSIFDESYLTSLMAEVGFRSVEHWDPASASWHDFEDASGRTYTANGRQYRISLNLQGQKGRPPGK